MKKYLITNIPNTLNYGSAMMAINLIYYFYQHSSKRIQFYCDAKNEFHLNRLKEETGLNNIYQFKTLPNNWNRLNKFKKAIFKVKYYNCFINKVVNSFDKVIVLGGDDFSEYYNKNFIITLYKLLYIKQLNSISKKIPVILYGQTIGPYTSWRKFIVKLLFKKFLVTTRDVNNYNYLKKNFDIKKLNVSRDLAFLELPNQNNTNVLTKYGLTKNNYICIVISGLHDQYCNSENIYIKNWNMIIRSLSVKFNKKIVLLAHVFCDGSSDQRYINAVNENENILKITDILLPSEARSILGNGYLSITGRMHAAISTFQMGKPAISLAYSIKYDGVIGDGLSIPELIIEKNESNWTSFQLCKLLMEKIDMIESSYEDIVEKIILNVKNCNSIILESIKKLSKE